MSITREQVRQYYRDRHKEYIETWLSITSRIRNMSESDTTKEVAQLVMDIANDLAIATPVTEATAPVMLLALEIIFNGIKADMSAEQQIVYSEASEAIIKSGMISAEKDT